MFIVVVQPLVDIWSQLGVNCFHVHPFCRISQFRFFRAWPYLVSTAVGGVRVCLFAVTVYLSVVLRCWFILDLCGIAFSRASGGPAWSTSLIMVGSVRNLPEIPSIDCLNPETDCSVKGLQPTPHRPRPSCVSAPHDRLQVATNGFTTGSQRTLADVIPCSGSRAMAVTPLEAYSWCRAGRHEVAACPPGFG